MAMNTLPDLFQGNSLFGFDRRPFRALTRMQRELDRMFEEFSGGAESWPAMPAALGGSAFEPSCDIDESDSHYLMSFDLPGVKKEDIKISLKDGLLTVSGERTEEGGSKSKDRSRSERFHGVYRRSFALPAGVKPEQIEADYKDGVLHVAVPKAEEARAQEIKIGEGKSGIWNRLVGHKKDETASRPQAQEKAA